MELTQEQIQQLETPCLVIDVKLAEKNIRRMQEAADQAGCRLRPHIKTHKMPLFAEMQMKAGASGITCAKVSEAEVMADGGMEDIFIAYPMVGKFRIQRAIALAKRIKRLILTIDSLEGAKVLNQAASDQDMILEVRMEIDTGAGRTGVPLDRAVELALALKQMKHLNLTGIFTFKSLILSGKPTEDNMLAAEEEGNMMAETALMLKKAGVEIQDISAGSSPTGVQVAQTGMVNEIRPGTYIFDDFVLRMRFGDGYRASHAAIRRWTDNFIGNMDDCEADVHNRSFENFVFAAFPSRPCRRQSSIIFFINDPP